MITPALPSAISRYFDAKNAHDVDGTLAAFADNASVHDEGRQMSGRAAIREWIEVTTHKYRDVAVPLAVEHDGRSTIVTARVSGTFPGSPVELRFRFRDDGENIASLEIGG